MQSKTKVHVTGNVYRHNPYTHYIVKNTFDFTALVSLNMPRLNENQLVIGLPVCSGHNGTSVGGYSSGLWFYSLMSLGLT